MKRIFLMLAVVATLTLGGLGLSQAQAGGPHHGGHHGHNHHGHNNHGHHNHHNHHGSHQSWYGHSPYRGPVYYQQSYRPAYRPYYVQPRSGIQIYGPRGGIQLRF